VRRVKWWPHCEATVFTRFFSRGLVAVWHPDATKELLEEAAGEPVIVIEWMSVEEVLDDRKTKLEKHHAR
jgi:hypothetical protein